MNDLSKHGESILAESRNWLSRRAFLSSTGMGMGAFALNLLASRDEARASALPRPHFAPKAKSIIVLHMVGAPSHLDLFDYKPELQKYDRKLAPKDFIEGKRFAFLRGHPKLLGTPYEFQRHGQGGAWVSELMPHLGSVSDDICYVKSVHTTEFNHGPAQMVFHCGVNRRGNPSLGSWVNYGLGSPNENLPGYVVFISGNLPGGGNSLWGNGFLPSVYQGVEFRSEGDPVLFLGNPDSVDASRRRRILDAVQSLNQKRHQQIADPEIETRMSQYEMAFRMQTSVPELMDLSDEPQSIRDMYGSGKFAGHCLYARRLVERGVRVVELFNESWDSHGSQASRLAKKCGEVDQPIAALLKDLKQRGLLDETLVVWAAEFGRTPMLQGTEDPDKCGRDHHKDAFTIWMAGGGIKGGITHGATDEMGFHVAENPTEVRDIHATLFHLLGLNHEDVTFRYQGLDQRLTGVEDARIMRELLV